MAKMAKMAKLGDSHVKTVLELTFQDGLRSSSHFDALCCEPSALQHLTPAAGLVPKWLLRG